MGSSGQVTFPRACFGSFITGLLLSTLQVREECQRAALNLPHTIPRQTFIRNREAAGCDCRWD